jgi:hypothetical protein
MQAGQRQAMFYLVEQGADVNAQSPTGETSLHLLVRGKRENLAVWLIKHGADIYLEDRQGSSPYDASLPWFQRDMKKVASDVDISKRYEVREITQTTYSIQPNSKQHTTPSSDSSHTASPAKSGAAKVHELLVLQRFDGSWELTGAFAHVIDISLEVLSSTQPSYCSASQWATAIALAVLRVRYAELSALWDLVAKRALKLVGEGALMAEAVSLVKK